MWVCTHTNDAKDVISNILCGLAVEWPPPTELALHDNLTNHAHRVLREIRDRITSPGQQARMCCACVTLVHMAKMIQIRNVPDELHHTLKIRAAKAGMTLSDYLLSEIEQVATRPTLAEMMERLRHDPPVELDEPPDVTVRRLRDADDPRNLG